MVARRRITFLPVSNMQKARKAQAAIKAAIGNAVLLLNTLTKPEVTAPIASCIPPINADAVPAFLLKGAMESAEEFGNTNPWQLKNISIKNIVDDNFKKANAVPST